MLEKFKELSNIKKGIIIFIGISLLPITILALGVYLLITGAMNKKIGKLITGFLLVMFIAFGVIVYEDIDQLDDNVVIETSSEKDKKEITLTKEELLKKLETYEGTYSVIPGAIQEVAKSNNKLEMQKTFSDSRSILEKCWLELGDIVRQYDQESDEYKASNNLQMAFYTLKEACEDGIKYLDKDEFKYFEKYEKNCTSSGAWINDYITYKEKIQ